VSSIISEILYCGCVQIDLLNILIGLKVWFYFIKQILYAIGNKLFIIMKKVIKKEILKLLNDNDNQYNLKKLRKSINKIITSSSNDIDDDAINKSFALALDSLLEKEKIVLVKDNVVINTNNDDSKKKKRNDDDDNNDNNQSKKNKHSNDDDEDDEDDNVDDAPSDDEMQTRQYATNELNKKNNTNDTDKTNDTNNSNEVKGDTTILLFYAYCDPQMTRSGQDAAIAFCYKTLKENEVTGRLRIGREGFNGNKNY